MWKFRPKKNSSYSGWSGTLYYRNATHAKSAVPIVSSRNAIVTMSWQILMYRIKIVKMFCVFWTLFFGTSMIMRNSSLLFFGRLSPDFKQILPNANSLCRNRFGIVPLLVRNSAMIYTSKSRQLQITIRQSPDKPVCNALQQTVIGLRSDCSWSYLIWRQFSNGYLPSASVHCLISVWSHSLESGRCRDRFGRFISCERYKSDKNRIENELIGTNSVGNG